MGRERDEARTFTRTVSVPQRDAHRLRGQAPGRRLHDETAERLDAQMAQPAVCQRGEAGAVREVVHQADAPHARAGGFLHRLKDIEAATVQMRTRVNVSVHGSGQKLGTRSRGSMCGRLHGFLVLEDLAHELPGPRLPWGVEDGFRGALLPPPCRPP